MTMVTTTGASARALAVLLLVHHAALGLVRPFGGGSAVRCHRHRLAPRAAAADDDDPWAGMRKAKPAPAPAPPPPPPELEPMSLTDAQSKLQPSADDESRAFMTSYVQKIRELKVELVEGLKANGGQFEAATASTAAQLASVSPLASPTGATNLLEGQYELVSAVAPTGKVSLAALLGLGGGDGPLAEVLVRPGGGAVRLAALEGDEGAEAEGGGGGGKSAGGGGRNSAMTVHWSMTMGMAMDGGDGGGDDGGKIDMTLTGGLVPEGATTLAMVPESVVLEGEVDTTIGSWLLAPSAWEVLYLDQDLLLYAPSTFEDHIVVLVKKAES